MTEIEYLLGEKDLLEGNLRASRLRCEQLEEKLQCVNDMLEQCERGMRHKDNGTADKRAGSREIVLRGSQYLPTMNGFVQMEFRPAKIVDGCVSTKK